MFTILLDGGLYLIKRKNKNKTKPLQTSNQRLHYILILINAIISKKNKKEKKKQTNITLWEWPILLYKSFLGSEGSAVALGTMAAQGHMWAA